MGDEAEIAAADETASNESEGLGRWRLAPWLCVLAAIAVYASSWGYGVLNYDSPHYIVQNPLVAEPSGASLAALWRPGSVDQETLYIPVSYTSWWLESAVGGGAGLRHVVNTLLHAACVGLLWLLGWRLTGRPGVATFAAALFALHPLQVESVAWLMGRKDLLSTLGALGAMLLWLRWRGRDCWWSLAGVVACCLFSWLAKPGTLVLPAMLLGLHWARSGERPGKRDIVGSAGLLALAIGVYLVNRAQAVAQPVPLSLAERLGALPEMLLGWLLRIPLLSQPQVYYDWPGEGSHFVRHAVFGLLTMVLIAALVWGWRAQRRVWVWGLVGTAIGFVPVVMVTVSYRHFLTADHYGHFPLLFVCLAIASLAPRNAAASRLWPALAAGVLVLALGRLWLNLPLWRDAETFWRAAVQQAPRAAEPRYNLAKTLEDAGYEVEAIRAYRDTVEIAPTHADANYNLANLLAAGPEPAAALPHYQAVVASNPGYVQAWINMGNLNRTLGRFDAAAANYQTASDYESPYRFIALMNKALTQQQAGDSAAALATYEAILADPASYAQHRERFADAFRAAIELAIADQDRPAIRRILTQAVSRNYRVPDPVRARIEAFAAEDASPPSPPPKQNP